MSFRKLNGRFDYTARLFDRPQTADLSDDYTLPDYMPAIGRVISCTAAVASPSLYLGGGSVEYAGGVRYRLLYESADDSSLWCAELPSEYDIILNAERDSARLPQDPAELSCLAEASPENVTARVTAPRRLTIKSRVRLSPDLSAKTSFETAIHGDPGDPDSVRTLEGSSESSFFASATNFPVICKDKISLAEAGLSPDDEYRVISSRGDVMISQLQISGDGADCRGEVSSNILLTREGEGERPRRIIRKIPFSATLPLNLPLPENSSTAGVRGYGVCPTVTASQEEDGIALEASLLLSAEIAARAPLSYLKDIYSKSADCECARKKLTLRTPAACFNGNATVSGSSDLASLGIDSGMRLCDISARILPDIEKTLSPSGRLTLGGKMKISAVADNGAELFPVEYDADYKYVAELPEAAGLASPEISVVAAVGETKGRIDSDSIVADCELCVGVLVEEKNEIEVLSEINLTPSSFVPKPASHICVCYPASGETLWDIAKKYRTEAEAIAEKNSLDPSASPDSPDSLSKSKFLII